MGYHRVSYPDWTILRADMPRIPDIFADGVIFLFPSEDDAKQSKPYGGSGFVVSVPFSGGKMFVRHHYFVTNRHVVDGGGLWVRYNAKMREFKIQRTELKDWTRHPTADLAVYPMKLDERGWNPASTYIEGFLTVRNFLEMSVGAGEDLFMVGRLVSHEGKKWNTPFLHTGSMAMVSLDTPLRNPDTGKDEPSFLIEMRSRSGFSGSPVYGHIDPERQIAIGDHHRTETTTFLLGILWGWLPTTWAIIEHGNKTGKGIQLESNIGAVLPAWELAEFLTTNGDLVKKRAEAEREWHESRRVVGGEIEPANESPPSELGDFTELLGKILQVPKDEADEAHRGHQE